MYTAKIVKTYDQPIKNDTINLDVTFSNGERVITKTFNLHAQPYPTLDSVKKLLKAECEVLEQFDVTVAELKALEGQVIE